jgi:hypothetical protein
MDLKAALRTALVLPLATAAVRAEDPPVPAADHLAAVEALRLDFSHAELIANDGASGDVELQFVSLPGHGDLTCVGEDCAYQPERAFVGVDRLAYRLLYSGGATAEVQVAISVSPQVMPLPGDWFPDGSSALGWYWAPEQKFFFARLDLDLEAREGAVSRPVACVRLPGSRQGWLPLAGDWDGNGRRDIGLFDPVQRMVVLYIQDPASDWPPQGLPGWLPWASFAFPEAGQGGLPFAGDWDGNHADEVGLVVPGDAWVRLATADGQGLAAHYQINLPDQTLWGPLRWPVAADWGGDGSGVDYVGLYEPAGRTLHVRLSHTDGPADVVLPYPDEREGMPPFAGDFGAGESIGFYIPSDEGVFGGFVVYPYDFAPDIGGRTPINAPPPEDPLVDLCQEL